MTFYEAVLAIHILAVVAWLGSAFLFHVLMFRAQRNPSPVRLLNLLEDMEPLGQRVFIPASVVALLAGIVLVIDGPWAFDQLWILIALVGYAAGFVIGTFFLTPAGERLGAIIGRDGGLSGEAQQAVKQVQTVARIDFVILVVILLDMVIKPTTDDVGALLLLAAVLVGGIGFAMSRLRASQATEPPSPAVASN